MHIPMISCSGSTGDPDEQLDLHIPRIQVHRVFSELFEDRCQFHPENLLFCNDYEHRECIERVIAIEQPVLGSNIRVKYPHALQRGDNVS